jgi:hypothetical protein
MSTANPVAQEVRSYPPLFIGAAAFLKRHRRATYGKEPRERLLAHLWWYWCDGRLGVARANGRIVAMAIARCVRDEKEAEQPYVHHEAAPMVWVDEAVSTHPLGLRQLLGMVFLRFGPRQVLAANRLKRNGELMKLPYQALEQLIEGETHEFSQNARTAQSA